MVTRPLGWRLRGSAQTQATTPPRPPTQQTVTWPTTDDAQLVDVHFRMSLFDFVRIASSVDVGRDIAYPEDSVDVWSIWVASFVSAKLSTPSPLQQKQVTISALSQNESEEPMCRFYTENVLGQTYLVEDCGCGNVRRFALTPQDDATSNSRPGLDSGGAPGNAVVVSSPNLTCYAEKSSRIVLQRIKDYASRIVDVINVGLDPVTSKDEVAEAAGEIIDIIRNANQFTSLQGLAKSVVNDALDTYVVAFGNAWNFDGSVTRNDLASLSNVFPDVTGVVPTALLYTSWVLSVNVRELNAQLAVVAAECETGNALPAPPRPIPNNPTYGIVKIGSGGVVPIDGSAITVANAGPRTLVGLVYEVVDLGTGSAGCGAGNPVVFEAVASSPDNDLSANYNSLVLGHMAVAPAAITDTDLAAAVGASSIANRGNTVPPNSMTGELISSASCYQTTPFNQPPTIGDVWGVVEL